MEGESCINYHECPVVKAYEHGKIDGEWIRMYCEGNWKECARFQLDEIIGNSPDFVLPDGSVEERLSR
ncbi:MULTISPECIES: hypothetical protein [unclassified Mesotoga]|uniref:hypothetical protein n=1 Tax=unclassified Mesotoga TaxID=1184398 RepID=UPI000EF1EB6C|nr:MULTISPECIES: hypothetical protein [unclassified Mesotoga]MDD3680915.1 hypothetical protein [Mesotoga sp.]MDD4207543.1 hypothetical protein [Mesotoga sp.]RLL86502.1 hypothetical protein Y697_05635 [Mesotoga sp. BH458_6_3_2_1]